MGHGPKHRWAMTDIWGEVMPRCTVCGLIGSAVTYAGPNSIGWRGQPAFGCIPTPSTKAEPQ